MSSQDSINFTALIVSVQLGFKCSVPLPDPGIYTNESDPAREQIFDLKAVVPFLAASCTSLYN